METNYTPLDTEEFIHNYHSHHSKVASGIIFMAIGILTAVIFVVVLYVLLQNNYYS